MAEGASQSPLVLVLLLLALWLAGFTLFSRYWRRTKSGQQWLEFRRRLDPAVRSRVSSIRILILVVSGVTIMAVAVHVRHLLHPNENPGEASARAVALLAFASYVIALFPTYMLTNLVWSLTPSMRKASREAQAGLDAVSFRNALVLLALQAAVVIPICLAFVYFGLVMQ